MTRVVRGVQAALLACALLSVASVAEAAPILFEGQTVTLTYEFPPFNNLVDSSTFVVGAGVEDPSLNTVAFDFSDTNIFVAFTNNVSWSNIGTFNGFHAFDVNGTIPAIGSVTINPATNLAGMNASRITFDADNIFVDWGGLSVTVNTRLSLDVSPAAVAAVPEPASLILIGSGLAGVAARARRRTSKAS